MAIKLPATPTTGIPTQPSYSWYPEELLPVNVTGKPEVHSVKGGEKGLEMQTG